MLCFLCPKGRAPALLALPLGAPLFRTVRMAGITDCLYGPVYRRSLSESLSVWPGLGLSVWPGLRTACMTGFRTLCMAGFTDCVYDRV